jgi:hypothetical protein
MEEMRELILAWTEGMKSDVIVGLGSETIRYLDKCDPRTVMTEACKEVDSRWHEFEYRISVLPGKEAFSTISREIQNKWHCSISSTLVSSFLTPADLRPDLRQVLTFLDEFA